MNEDFFDKNNPYGDRERRDGYSPSGNRNGYEGRPRYERRDNQGGGNYENRPYGNRPYGERRPNPRYDEGGYNRYNQEGGNGQPRPHRPRISNGGQSGYVHAGHNTYNGEQHDYNREDYRPGYNAENRFSKRPPHAGSRFGGPRQGQAPRYGQYNHAPYNGEHAQQEGERPAYGRRPYGGNSYGGGGYKKRPQRQGYNPNAKYSHKKRLEYKETNIDPNQPVRLNRFLANAGVCSRREADAFITSGVVSVNGVVVTELGTKVLRSDIVHFHDQAVKMEKKVYVLLNKPKGYVTTSDDPQNRKTVMELVKDACPERIYPVGRLDRSTTGVLLFTNDGDLATRLTHPKFLKKKIYHVHTDKNVTMADLHQIKDGIMLEDGEIKADDVDYASLTDKKQVGIEIHSGKNRIVRRIFEHLGYQVVKLDRVYFAGLTKKNVRRGDWRYLTEKEVEMLRMGAYE